jgi:alcohol dehydrogenase
MARLGYTDRVLASLAAAGMEASVFSEMPGTPTTHDVDRAAETARDFDADLVIGLGGGSALDCAKAVAGVAPRRIPCAEYLHGRELVSPQALPIVAIPTTAGTGSEMNRSAILTDPAIPHKDAVRSDHLFPRVALVDPELTLESPADVTAQTGFDALAHAVESYVSPRSQPLGDALALEAVAGVVAALPRALAQPHDLLARERLALAATSMGYNLSCVGTCLPHRLDKPLCAMFPRLSHGQAIAFLYRAWVDYSWRGCPARFARLAAVLDPAVGDWPIDEAASACGDLLTKFIQQIGLGRTLASQGMHLPPSTISQLAERVSGDLRVNPVPIERGQLNSFYQQALGW